MGVCVFIWGVFMRYLYLKIFKTALTISIAFVPFWALMALAIDKDSWALKLCFYTTAFAVGPSLMSVIYAIWEEE